MEKIVFLLSAIFLAVAILGHPVEILQENATATNTTEEPMENVYLIKTSDFEVDVADDDNNDTDSSSSSVEMIEITLFNPKKNKDLMMPLMDMETGTPMPEDETEMPETKHT